MKRQFLRFAPWVVLMVLGVVGTSRPANTEPQREERHPRIAQAIDALRGAQEYMRDAAHDFCGHKQAAMRDTDRAMRQLQAALACDRR